MAVALPPSLPAPAFDGNVQQEADIAETCEYEAGEDRRAPITRTVPNIVRWSWALNQAQFDDYVDWFEADLQAGTLAIDLPTAEQGGRHSTTTVEALLLAPPIETQLAPDVWRVEAQAVTGVTFGPTADVWDADYVQGLGVVSGGGRTFSESIDDEQTWTRSVATIQPGQKVYWRVTLSSTGDTDHFDQFHGIRGAAENVSTNLVSGSTCVIRTQGNVPGSDWIAYVGSTGAVVNPGGGSDWGNGQLDSDDDVLWLAFENSASGASGKLWVGRESVGAWLRAGADPASGAQPAIGSIPSGVWHAFCGIDNDDGDNTAVLGRSPPAWAGASLAGFTQLGV